MRFGTLQTLPPEFQHEVQGAGAYFGNLGNSSSILSFEARMAIGRIWMNFNMMRSYDIVLHFLAWSEFKFVSQTHLVLS